MDIITSQQHQRNDYKTLSIGTGAAISPHPSSFAPLLFAGRLAEGIEALQLAGYDAIEISLKQAAEVDVQWLEEQLAEKGLVISALATGRMCLEDSLCFANPDLNIRRQLVERFASLLHLAAHFKASVIIGGVRGKLSTIDQEREQQIVFAVETLQQCARIATGLGVNLLIEPINHQETNFINSAAEGLQLIEAIGYPCAKLLLDTYHMNIEEADACETIRKTGKYLGYVHFSDDNRQSPGRGQIDFPSILDALAEIGYQGFITVEILPEPNDTSALRNAGRYLRSLNLIKG